MPARSRPPSPAAAVLPYRLRCPAEAPVRGWRWSVTHVPVPGWTDCDRGPQADAEERTRSAHRAIEISQKRRRVLSLRPASNNLRPKADAGRKRRPPCMLPAIGRAELRDRRAPSKSAREVASHSERRFAHLICEYASARSVTALIARPAGPAGRRATSGHRGGGEMRACCYGRPGITWGVSCSMSWRARSSAIAASSGPAALATSSASSRW